MRDIMNYSDSSTFSTASGAHGLQYVVLQVTLKEKFIGTGSGNLTELEKCDYNLKWWKQGIDGR